MSKSIIHFFKRGQKTSREHKENALVGEMSKPLSPEVLHNSASGERLDDSGSVKSDDIDAPLPVLKVDNEDYLYAAALELSHAVSEEVYQRYDVAFERYKKGIDLLITGAKNDCNETRKKIAKIKAEKYLERAETLYEKNLLDQKSTFIFSTLPSDDTTNSTIPDVKSLERPLSNLSKYTVTKVFSTKLIMQVQDVTSRCNFVMKVVWFDHNKSIFLPQNILYMVDLVAYFQSENALYLLLKPCGQLWDYIKSYTIPTRPADAPQIEDLFVDPIDIDKKQEVELSQYNVDLRIKSSIESISDLDSGFSEKCKINISETEALDEILNDYDNFIPSFDTLSKEMDVNELVNCSQQLLNSVSKTLKRSEAQAEPKVTTENVVFSNHIEESSDLPAVEENLVNNIITESVPLATLPLEISVEASNINLPEVCLKQWARELVVAVHSLHQNEIICGDLNIDNLLLGSSGQLLLTFFYRKHRNYDDFMCNLNLGALHDLYVAPERPLTKNSDWFSVGIILYEMLTKKRFFKYHPGGFSCYFEIQYPQPGVSNVAKDLLEGLIAPAEFRMDYEAITFHPFFQNTNWQEVNEKGR